MIHEHVFKQSIHINIQELTKQTYHLNIMLKHFINGKTSNYQ